jgi:negative regulator of sigma E activity
LVLAVVCSRQKEIGGDGSEKLKALEKSIADAQAALNERKQIRARLDDELIQLRLKSQQLLDDQVLLGFTLLLIG